MSNKVIGSDTAPKPALQSLQKLIQLRPKTGNEYGVFAFVLNREMITENGSLDDLHGMVFMLGSFETEKLAEEHAKNVISITGHPGVIVAKYAAAVPLTNKFDPKIVTQVPIDPSGRIVELESAQYKKEKEIYEKRVKLEKELVNEAEEETDPDSIEHFKRQAYLAVKNYATVQFHTQQAKEALENYNKRKALVVDHYKRHPEHEEKWLPILEEKLIRRGEESLFHQLKSGYEEIRTELLNDKSDNKSIENIIGSNVDTYVKTMEKIENIAYEAKQ